VEVHVSLAGSYRPPVFNQLPPHTSMTLPVQTAVWYRRGVGALTVEVDNHVSLAGS
jgi:hypothetical protein